MKDFLKNLRHPSNRIYVMSRRDANYLEKTMCQSTINISELGYRENYEEIMNIPKKF